MANNTDGLNINNLNTDNVNIAKKILETDTIEDTKNLVALFNLNNQKRNVIRISKMTNLLDTITDQIINRFEKYPNNFSNEDLLKYMQVTEASLEKANKNLNQVEDAPSIQLLQNNELNISINNSKEDVLNNESRLKVLETVKSFLSNLDTTNAIEIEEFSEVKDNKDVH